MLLAMNGLQQQRCNFSRRLNRFTSAAKIQSGCAEHFSNGGVSANRALNQTQSLLVLKVGFGCKPSFKHMFVGALKIQYFHSLSLALCTKTKRPRRRTASEASDTIISMSS